MNILVTGGSGNIGREVVAELLTAGHDVCVFDEREPSTPGVPFVVGSITQPTQVETAVQGRDAVIHLAAIPSYRPDRPAADYMTVNVLGTANVFEAAGKLGVGNVVLASSDSALGFVFGKHPYSPDYLPVDEAHPLRPEDPYGLSKLLGEEIAKSAARRYGIRAICLRFCWVWFEDTFAHRAEIVGGDPATLARTLWGYVDVRDAAQACRLAAESADAEPGDAFFITAEDTYADAPTLELIEAHYPGAREISDVFLVERYASLFDISKARRVLGYAPKHSWR